MAAADFFTVEVLSVVPCEKVDERIRGDPADIGGADKGLPRRDLKAYKADYERGRENRVKLPLPFQFLAAWIGVWVGR